MLRVNITPTVQEGILEEIDAIFRDEVARQRPSFIPKDIQAQLREQQRQLEELQRALHDSCVVCALSGLSIRFLTVL